MKGGAAKDFKPCPLLRIIPAKKIVAKSIKALNHREHREHKGKEKLFFVLFVFSVVPFFSEPFATPSIAGMINGMSREAICHNLEDRSSLLVTNLQPCRNIDDKFLPAASPNTTQSDQLTRRPTHLPTSEQVQVQVIHRLTTMAVGVERQAITILSHPFPVGNIPGHQHHLTQ